MFRNKLMVSALSTVCLLSSQALFATAASASPLRANVNVQAFKGPKLVKLSLANASTETIHLMVGEEAMSLEPGKTVQINVATGTKIVNVDATKTHGANEMITQVSKELSGATLRIS